jgi:hypothetical protein
VKTYVKKLLKFGIACSIAVSIKEMHERFNAPLQTQDEHDRLQMHTFVRVIYWNIEHESLSNALMGQWQR